MVGVGGAPSGVEGIGGRGGGRGMGGEGEGEGWRFTGWGVSG